MNSFAGRSLISFPDISAEKLRITGIEPIVNVLNLFIASQTFDLLNFIYGSLAIALEFISQDQYYLFNFILDELKGNLDLVLLS